MNQDPYIDRPRPRLPWWVWLSMLALSVVFVIWPLSWSDAKTAVWLVIVFPGLGFIWWSYFDVRYELNNDSLKARTMFFGRITVPLDEIDQIELFTSFWSSFHPRNLGAAFVLNRWAPTLRIVYRGKRVLLISPTNPEEMRDEILRRRDAARSNSR